MKIDNKILSEVSREIEDILNDDGDDYELDPKAKVNIINGTRIEMNVNEIETYLRGWYLIKVILFAIKDGLNSLSPICPELSTVPGAVLRLSICYLRSESQYHVDKIIKYLENPEDLTYEKPISLLMDLQKCIYENKLVDAPIIVAKLLIAGGYHKNYSLYTNIETEILQDLIILHLSTKYGMTRGELMDNCFPNLEIFKNMTFQEKLDSINIYSEQFSWNEF